MMGSDWDPQDGLAVLSLVTKLDRLATKRKADEYAANFTMDGAIVGEEGDVVGSQLKDFVTETWAREPAGTWHITGSPEIIELTKDHAVVQSLLLLIGSDKQLMDISEITQTFKKINGRWYVTKREIEI